MLRARLRSRTGRPFTKTWSAPAPLRAAEADGPHEIEAIECMAVGGQLAADQLRAQHGHVIAGGLERQVEACVQRVLRTFQRALRARQEGAPGHRAALILGEAGIRTGAIDHLQQVRAFGHREGHGAALVAGGHMRQ